MISWVDFDGKIIIIY